MQAAEAVEYANHIEPSGRPAEATIIRELLMVAEEHLSARAKKAIVAELLARAEAFRRADQPGHRLWYPYHTAIAAAAVERYS